MLLAIVAGAAFTLYALRLEPEQYGVLYAVLSTVLVLQATRGATASYIVLHAAGDENALPTAIRNAVTFSLLIGMVMTITLIACAPFLRSFLHLSGTLPFVLVGISAVPNVFGGIADGILNVRKQFLALSLVAPIMVMVKIAAAVWLFSDGFHETDAGWIALLTECSGLIAFALVDRSSLVERLPHARRIFQDMREVGTLLSASLLFGFAHRIDILWARHALSPTDAGTYAMMLGIAMVVLSITSGVARVATVWQRSSSPGGVLKASYTIIIITAAMLSGGFILLGEPVLFLLAGKSIPIDWNILLPLFAAMTCLSIIVLDYSSFNILTKRVHAGMGAMLIAAQATGLFFFATSAASIAWIQFIVMASLMGIFSLSLWKYKRRNGDVSHAHPAEMHLMQHP